MIKHRLIVSETDFRVFAAIPTEGKLLTWEKWQRPPDWQALRLIFETTGAVLGKMADLWEKVSEGYKEIATMEVPENLQMAKPSEKEKQGRKVRLEQSLETAMLSAVCREEADRSKEIATMADLPVACSDEARRFLTRVSSESSMNSLNSLVAMAQEHVAYYDGLFMGKNKQHNKNIRTLGKKEAELVLDSVLRFYHAYEILLGLFNEILTGQRHAIDVVRAIDNFNDPALPADLECPVGVPYAAYVIEVGTRERRINVVEGKAWVEAVHHLTLLPRDTFVHDLQATEDEKRVAEIVSQMLVERGQNPKAPTRISLREVDPAHAHEQRQAEARGGPARVRTIKFHVSPPRYLREAAEVILASPRKAHWVVGHWRNQPYGEGRTLHKQKWIAPHIRGLGEAGATTVRMVAQKDGRAEVEKPEGDHGRS